MTKQAAADLVDGEDLKGLERAADGLGSSGIAAALIGADVDPSRGLAGVPQSKVSIVEGCLIAASRTDPRPAVATHLGPFPGDSSSLREKAIAVSEARSKGYRAFEAAKEAYNEELSATLLRMDARLGSSGSRGVPEGVDFRELAGMRSPQTG